MAAKVFLVSGLAEGDDRNNPLQIGPLHPKHLLVPAFRANKQLTFTFS